MLQDCLGSRPIAGVLAHIRPSNVPGLVNDEDGRGGHAIAEQIIYAISLRYSVIGVGQEGKRSACRLGHTLRAGHVVHGQRQDLGVMCLKFLIETLQIHDLLAAGASGLAPVKDQHHIRFACIVAQGN